MDYIVDNQPYDVEKFGQYYRPYGVEAPSGANSQSTTTPIVATTPTPTPVATQPVVPVVEAPIPAPQSTVVETPAAPVATADTADAGGKRAEDILAMIRNRQS